MNFRSDAGVLKKQLKNALKSSPPPQLDNKEKKLLETIRYKTKKANQNNVTRTKAYLDFFLIHPEIHWALLAHLVSRNAGWNMTDLKGTYLPKLLTAKEAVDFYMFLERGNWLIFQDAYPQLLLYEYSRKRGEPLWHLLPSLNVSAFMRPFWERFWESGCSEEITKALIVNEQHYIENRVLNNSLYMHTVMDKVMFKLQELMSMNHILFPYLTPVQKRIKLTGGTVHHFTSVNKRVSLGRSLYDLLYSIESRLESIILWAESRPHTGSRADYWPELFLMEGNSSTPVSSSSPCRGLGRNKLFSPALTSAWDDWIHPHAEEGDWFTDCHVLRLLKKKPEKFSGEIEAACCQSLEEVHTAVQAKQTFFP
ncbi:DUF2515 family protein [Halobacillus kuroshimensis]|uniref:DUF2515 family protein n=1 Tax=Halobacillus kuroshimensis TaxID=302481 RepID=UPI0030FA5114